MRTTLTLSLIIAFVGLFAQPTIQQFPFDPGTVFVADGNFPITSEGASGANVTWDLSAINFSSEHYTYTALDINTVAFADQFPGATAAFSVILSPDVTAYFFNDFTNGFIDYGETILNGGFEVYMPYSDPQTYCTTPLAFGNSGTDAYALTSLISGFNSSTTGTVTWNVDAYGTLVLPNATYTDVLRVHTTENEVNTIDAGGVPITSQSSEESWHWFKAGYTLPLLTYSLFTDQSGTTQVAPVALISMANATGVSEEKLPAFSVQPNPSNGVVFVTMETPQSMELHVLDLAGRMVHTERSTNTNSHTLDLSHLGAGSYILRIVLEHGMQTRVIVLE